MKNTTAVILILGLLLGSYKGYLALYETTDPDPKQIFPCAVDTLPEADQMLLEQGLRVRNPKMLAELLEDYLS